MSQQKEQNQATSAETTSAVTTSAETTSAGTTSAKATSAKAKKPTLVSRNCCVCNDVFKVDPNSDSMDRNFCSGDCYARR
jgi:hypothetical protein